MEIAERIQHLQVTMIRKFVSAAPEDVVNFGLGQTNTSVSEPILQRLPTGNSSATAPYIPNAGLPELRAEIAWGYDVDPGRVIVTCGVQQGLFLAMMATLEPGMRVAVPDPGFPVYASIARIFGATPVTYELSEAERFRPTREVIEAVVDEGVDMIVLCSPGNPTGAVAEPEEWDAIGSLLNTHEVISVSDEIYRELGADGDMHSSLIESCPDAICLSGLSKSHGLAGWRLGWLVVPDEISSSVIALHQHMLTSASSLVQEAALGAFSPEGEAAITGLRADLSSKRKRLREALKEFEWVVASGDGALYLWVRHPVFQDGYELARTLRDDFGVLTIPGRAFGEGGARYVRISYSIDEAKLAEGVRRLEAFSKSGHEGAHGSL